MKEKLKPIADAMLAVVLDPRASKIERIEAAKVLLACHGCLIPDVNEEWLSVRQVTKLRQMKQEIVTEVLKKKERKKRANRKTYLRRLIAKAEATQAAETAEGEHEQIN